MSRWGGVQWPHAIFNALQGLKASSLLCVVIVLAGCTVAHKGGHQERAGEGSGGQQGSGQAQRSNGLPPKHVSAAGVASNGANLIPTSYQSYEYGLKLYNRWLALEEDNWPLLFEAEALLKAAYQAHPDNVLYQLEYYAVTLNVLASKPKFSERAAWRLFQTLHPVVQAESVSPAFVTYSFMEGNDSLSQRIDVLKRAIKQNPYNPQNWYVLSQLYVAQNQYHMAAAMAHRALTLLPDSPVYAFQYGASLGHGLEQNACVYQHKPGLKIAAKYLAKAVSKKQDNPYYLTALSRQYLHLGIFPLAYAQAKKAYEIKSTLETARNYFYAGLYTNNLNSVQGPLAYLVEHHGEHSHLEVALAAWRLDVDRFVALLVKTDQSQQSDFHTLNMDYLTGMERDEFRDTVLALESESLAKHYVLGEAALSDQAFISQATNECQKAEYAFYTAIQQWRNGNKQGFVKTLHNIQRQKVPLVFASLWAKNILSEKKTAARRGF